MTLTPQQRLAASRRAIVQNMHSDRDEHDQAFAHGDARVPAADSVRPMRPHSSGLKGLWRSARRTASAWWRSHPAGLAVDVAQPMVEKYAQAHPLKLIGIAATVGAVLVVTKPWRLISVTGVLLAALRSTQVSSLIASVVSPPRDR